MIEIFEDIEEFFQQKQFTQEQLNTLKESIEIKYRDSQTRKLANSAVNIKLLQYKLSGPLEARVDRNLKRDKSQLNIKKNSSSTRLTRGERKRLNQEEKTRLLIANSQKDVVDIFYEHNINKLIKKAAIYLAMPLETFINRLIVPDGVVITEKTRFTEDIWNNNVAWISSNLKKDKVAFKTGERKMVKKKRKKSISDGSVYSKLANSKNIGPLIYTRM